MSKKNAAETARAIEEELDLEHIGESFIRQHRGWLAALVIALMGGGGCYAGLRYFSAHRQKHAEEEMTQAIYHFEAGRYATALVGESPYPGLEEIIRKYPRTKAKRLARLYAGIAYYHQKRYNAAIKQLKGLRIKSPILQARAYVMLGDAYAQAEDYTQAAICYEKGAKCGPNASFSPYYWQKAAIAHEAAGRPKAAKAAYQAIINKFAKSSYVDEAKQHVARLSTAKHG